MGIFDFLSGQFIDVIHWTDDTRDTMVWRFEREGHEIKYGAKLTVREGQAAVFVHEGSVLYGHLKGLTSAHSRGAVQRPSEALRHRYGETLEMTSGNFAVHARRW